MKPVVLIILDGWGVAPASDGNAIERAKTPNFKHWVTNYPAMTLIASGNEVGLSWGEMGNSEVGHLNIGAGRVYYQTFPRINHEIATGDFFKNHAFLKAVGHIKKTKGALHLLGLVSPGNVHASQDHLYALLQFATQQKIKKVFVHAILDGRDTARNSAATFIKELQLKMEEYGVGKIASICGRFYAMDRDNRWDRTEKVYRTIMEGKAELVAENPESAIEDSYNKKIYDEEFPPTVIVEKSGVPVGKMADGDAIIFFNFRPDRARQLTHALALPSFPKFERTQPDNLMVVTMTEYEKNLPVIVAYLPQVVGNCLAEVVSKSGAKQFHVAETEKYAHITFFLNGTVEDAFPGEDRAIIPSPRVSSYDSAPAMSCMEIADAVTASIKKNLYELIVCNFANADMVGHTGNIEPCIKGIEYVDKAMGKIVDQVMAHGGVAIITADHGNAEEMLKLTSGEMDKEHSTNPVPFIIIGSEYEGRAGSAGDAPNGDLSLIPPVGVLADVAPTVLKIMGIAGPIEMTGRPLI